MELLLLVLLACLVLVAGGVLGWISFFRLRRLEERLARLERHGTRPTPDTPSATKKTPTWAEPASRPAAEPRPEPRPEPPAPTSGWLSGLFGHLREHWMVWLGGLSVGLAGIFLVRYSIEQGYLGPAARITAGLFTGLALHALAEWLRRYTAERSDAVAALAGGASLTLYAAVLAALHLYGLWPVPLVFAALALVSLVTIALALWHGPVLAILGLLGGYAVPLLLGTESDELLTVLAYALVIALSGFTLMRWVYRDWLWWGTVVGAMFWWWAALMAGQHTEGWLGLYLAVIAWGMLAIRWDNWRLNRPFAAALPTQGPTGWRRWLRIDDAGQRLLAIGLLVLLAAQGISIAHDPQWAHGPLVWLPLLAVILVAARFNEHLRLLPWTALIVTVVGLLLAQATVLPTETPTFALDPVLPADRQTLYVFLGLLGGLFALTGLWTLRERTTGLVAAQAVVPPLVAVALAYLLAGDALPPWGLSVFCVIYGAGLLNLAAMRLRRETIDTITFWLIVGGHLAYSLAVVIAFDEATLTLALAAQLVSLTWLRRRFAVPGLDWLVKLVLAVIVIRLTLNPWLLSYEAGTHWTLWTYGGSLLLTVIAGRLLPPDAPLRRWLEGGMLHLLVLFLAAELRWWLYDGAVFAPRFDFLEAAIDTNLAAALALVYWWRSGLSAHLRVVYVVAGRVMMALAVLGYFYLWTHANPLWGGVHAGEVGETPVFNLLLLAYGLPALFWALAARHFEPGWRPLLAALAGVAAWSFITFEIRHLWQGELSLASHASNGELYTYSAAWLVMAMTALLVGMRQGNRAVYRGGLVLLGLVIVKIFLVDMGGLTGLLRAISFMGLGLSLLALAYLHQSLARRGSD